ncbi:MAG: pilus assembly protein TadG-related protein [Hyphomicrobiaceae bacterium]
MRDDATPGTGPSAPSTAAVPRVLAAFAADQRGVTAMLLAICFAVMMFITAMALDYGRAELERMHMQRVLDSATLAASHQLGSDDPDTKGRAAAEAFFKLNSQHVTVTQIETLEMDVQKGEVRATAGGSVLTSLLNAFDIPRIEIGAGSRVVRGDGTMEIALVLDNSGSMAGQPITDLKTAATNLVNTVYAGVIDSERVKVALVPFAGSVNVGAENRTAPWMDSAGLSPIHHQNQLVAEKRTRFQLFDDLNRAWGGCVEARPAPYDTNDTAPAAATPATLFVPMFAPDEPDNDNDGGLSYPNNYMSDFGGTCPAPTQICVNFNTRRNRCDQYGNQPLSPIIAQGRTCKYKNASFTGAGPNTGCTTRPIEPLNGLKSEVTTAISQLTASGMTNIGEGVMWGWRTLSPSEPFTEGRPYTDTKNTKIMIVMTDGENTYNTYNNQNKTGYLAYGYGLPLPAPLGAGQAGRLGTTYTQSGIVGQINSKTAAACANAKAEGITVYTIAFRLETNPTTLSLLRACASSTDKAYLASDGAALIQIFQVIGREISQIRVAG